RAAGGHKVAAARLVGIAVIDRQRLAAVGAVGQVEGKAGVVPYGLQVGQAVQQGAVHHKHRVAGAAGKPVPAGKLRHGGGGVLRAGAVGVDQLPLKAGEGQVARHALPLGGGVDQVSLRTLVKLRG